MRRARETGAAQGLLIALILFFLFCAALVGAGIGCAPVREPLDGGVTGEDRYTAPRFLDTLHPDAAAIRARYGWPYPVRIPSRPPRRLPGEDIEP